MNTLVLKFRQMFLPLVLALVVPFTTMFGLVSPGVASASHSAYWNRSGYAGVDGWYNGGQGYVGWQYWWEGREVVQYYYFSTCLNFDYYSDISLDMWDPDKVVSSWVIVSSYHSGIYSFNPG